MAGKTSGRIIATKNVDKTIALAKSVYKKHQADGSSSFLTQLEGSKWEDVGPGIGEAEKAHAIALDLKRQSEEAFRKRDALLAPITSINNASKKLLKGKYAANPKKLGEWGYDVDDTPPRPRKKKTA